MQEIVMNLQESYGSVSQNNLEILSNFLKNKNNRKHILKYISNVEERTTN